MGQTSLSNPQGKDILMKQLWALASCLLFTTEAAAQTNWRALWNIWSLKGPVKIMRETHFPHMPVPNGAFNNRPNWSMEVRYDEAGKLLCVIHLFPPVTKTTESYSYDETNRVVKMESHREELKFHYVQLFGLLFYLPFSISRTPGGAAVFKCDDQSRFLETSFFYTDEKLNTRNLYRYEKGLKIIEAFKGEGVLYSTDTSTYNDNGQPLERSLVFAETGKTQRFYYEYDAEGRRLTYTATDGDGDLAVKSLYGDHGHAIEQFNYDKAGRTVRHSTCAYEFDSRGNWKTSRWKTKMTINGKDETLYSVVRRDITYH